MTNRSVPSRETILRNLKSHSKVRRMAIEPGEMARTINRETDRGAVILVGSLIEDVLLEKMERSFRPLTKKEYKELLGPDGPIGTFSNRLRLAYALGLIDKETLSASELLKAMRNACAHSRAKLSFEDDVLLHPLILLLKQVPFVSPDLSNALARRASLVIVSHFVLRAIDTGSHKLAAIETGETLRDTLRELANLKD